MISTFCKAKVSMKIFINHKITWAIFLSYQTRVSENLIYLCLFLKQTLIAWQLRTCSLTIYTAYVTNSEVFVNTNNICLTTVQVFVNIQGGESRLLLTSVSNRDTGNYTCQPANAQPSFIALHIIPGELRFIWYRVSYDSHYSRWVMLHMIPGKLQITSYLAS